MGDYKKAGRAQGARRQIDKTEYFQALDAIALIGHHDTSHNLAVRRNVAVNKSDNAPSGSLRRFVMLSQTHMYRPNSQ